MSPSTRRRISDSKPASSVSRASAASSSRVLRSSAICAAGSSKRPKWAIASALGCQPATSSSDACQASTSMSGGGVGGSVGPLPYRPPVNSTVYAKPHLNCK
jgi:hypothetical protein